MYASIWMIKQMSALQLFVEAAGFAPGVRLTSIYLSTCLSIYLSI